MKQHRPPGNALFPGYRALIDRLKGSYPTGTHAVVVALMDFLYAMHEQAVLPGGRSTQLDGAIRDIADEVCGLYRQTPAPSDTLPRRSVSGRPARYIFDRDYYRSHYSRFDREVGSAVAEVGREAFSTVRPGSVYLYVIDENGRLLVCRHPLSVDDMLLQRNPRVAGVEVYHPMLVADSLTVLAAGEIAFFGRGEVRGVVANLKSGHFRPDQQCLPWLDNHLRDMFGSLDLLTLLPVEVGADR